MRRSATLAVLLFCVPLVAQEETRYAETIDVVRYVLAVRATDGTRAVGDLAAGEFLVEIDGKAVVVEDADWLAETSAPDAAQPEPEHFAILVQTDFGRAPERVEHHMKFNLIADRLLSILPDGAPVAVLSHDSHLELRLDFTTDREAVLAAIRRAIRIEAVAFPEVHPSGASIARHLDARAMKNAATPEAALLLISRALAEIEGEKAILLVGWGIGQAHGAVPHLKYAPEWNEAIGTMSKHHIPVLSLGTGLIGGRLTRGLIDVANRTGGFYRRADDQGFAQVESFVRGRYELVVRVDGELPPGQHRLTARSRRRGVTILAPAAVVVSPGPPMPTIIEQDLPPARSALDLYREAMGALLDGDAKRAESLFTEVLDIDPQFAEAWLERGLLRAGAGEREGAIADLKTFLALAPRSTRAAEAQAILRSL